MLRPGGVGVARAAPQETQLKEDIFVEEEKKFLKIKN